MGGSRSRETGAFQLVFLGITAKFWRRDAPAARRGLGWGWWSRGGSRLVAEMSAQGGGGWFGGLLTPSRCPPRQRHVCRPRRRAEPRCCSTCSWPSPWSSWCPSAPPASGRVSDRPRPPPRPPARATTPTGAVKRGSGATPTLSPLFLLAASAAWEALEDTRLRSARGHAAAWHNLSEGQPTPGTSPPGPAAAPWPPPTNPSGVQRGRGRRGLGLSLLLLFLHPIDQQLSGRLEEIEDRLANGRRGPGGAGGPGAEAGLPSDVPPPGSVTGGGERAVAGDVQREDAGRPPPRPGLGDGAGWGG